MYFPTCTFLLAFGALSSALPTEKRQGGIIPTVLSGTGEPLDAIEDTTVSQTVSTL